MNKTGGRRGSNQYGPIGVSEERARRLRQDPLLLDSLADIPPDENKWDQIEVYSQHVAKFWYAAGWDDPEEAQPWWQAGYSPVGARILANAGFPPPPDPQCETPAQLVEVERVKRAHLEWVRSEIRTLRDEHASALSRGRDYDPNLDSYIMDALRACDLESPQLALSFLAGTYKRLGRIPADWQV